MVWLINILGMSEDMACLNRNYCFVSCFSCMYVYRVVCVCEQHLSSQVEICKCPTAAAVTSTRGCDRRPGTSSLYNMSKDRQGPSEKQLLRSDRTMTPDTGKGKARMEIQWAALHA